ncbi:MAG: hypothetical protein ACRCX8_05095 [Sarcina sp.]
MEEYKGLTISEFIEILKRFPQDAKIGTCEMDTETHCIWISNNISITDLELEGDVKGSENERCDYYIW